MTTKKIALKDPDEALALLGEQDAVLRQLERDCGVDIFLKSDSASGSLMLVVRGTSAKVERAFRRLADRLGEIRSGSAPGAAGAPAPPPLEGELAPLPEDAVYRSAYGKLIRPRTKNQAAYVSAMLSHEMVFGIGPAGTGKTFLAVACALRALASRQVHRIILSRPVVEAGERLGFLPGDLLEKVNPYLKPLYDAFYALLGPQRFRMWRENEVVEVVPLAYMRGRTFEDAFILLDEAQNTTPEQMKMFLTRMGSGSRVVVTGDITQTDLDAKLTSGLIRILEILKGVDGISFHHLTEEDIVRHPLVKKVLRAYENWERRQ